MSKAIILLLLFVAVFSLKRGAHSHKQTDEEEKPSSKITHHRPKDIIPEEDIQRIVGVFKGNGKEIYKFLKGYDNEGMQFTGENEKEFLAIVVLANGDYRKLIDTVMDHPSLKDDFIEASTKASTSTASEITFASHRLSRK